MVYIIIISINTSIVAVVVLVLVTPRAERDAVRLGDPQPDRLYDRLYYIKWINYTVILYL